jgi:hypothetical protein
MEKVNYYSEKKMQSRIKHTAPSICLLFILLLSFTKAHSQSFKVVKIDTTANHYLIFITKGDSLKGIIVSEKKTISKSKKTAVKIETGQEYKLDLEKYRLLKFMNKTSFETETSGKGGITVDGVVVWRVSDNYGLYETKNLRGLFYIKCNS